MPSSGGRRLPDRSLARGCYWCPAVSVCVVFSVAGVVGGVADKRIKVPTGRTDPGRCTRAPSRVCAACAASGVRTRPIHPCRWGRHPCRASLALAEVGSQSIGIASTSTAGGLRCSSAAPRESSETRTRDPSSTTCTGAPLPPPLRRLRESRSTARLHPAVQVSEVVALAAPYCRGDRRRRGLRRHAVTCRVSSRPTRYNPDGRRGASYGFGAPDRPLRGRPGPRRQVRCSPGRGRARTSTAPAVEPAGHSWTGVDDTLATTGGSSGSRCAEGISWCHEP